MLKSSLPAGSTFPTTVRIELNRCDGADAYDGRPDVTRVDGFTVEWIAHGINDVLRS